MNSIGDLWHSLQILYFTMDRVWLGAGIVACVLLGSYASRYVEEHGLIWQGIVMILVAVGLFVFYLEVMQVNPVLFSPEALARSQVGM